MENFHKILVSDKTFERITPAMLENLHQNSIKVVVVKDIDHLSEKMKEMIKQYDIIVEDKPQEMPQEPEVVVPYELLKRVEIEPIAEYQPRQKNKPYIPRTIGKPNARKKGGR